MSYCCIWLTSLKGGIFFGLIANLKGHYFQPSLSVCLCLWPALLPFNIDRFWWILVTRTLLWSSLATTIMVQIGRRGTVRRLFENLKNSQKSKNSNFKILVHHFLASVSPVYCKKKFDSIRTKLTEEIHFWSLPLSRYHKYGRDTPSSLQAPTRCGMPVAQRTTPFAVGKVWHRRPAKRYVEKLDIGRVHKFVMQRIRKFGIWARLEVGIGHDIRRAFRNGGIRTDRLFTLWVDSNIIHTYTTAITEVLLITLKEIWPTTIQVNNTTSCPCNITLFTAWPLD